MEEEGKEEILSSFTKWQMYGHCFEFNITI